MDQRDKWAQLHRLEAELSDLRRELGLPTERIAQDLSQRARLLRAAEQVAHVGSWMWDLQSGEVAWSDELYRVLGLDRGMVAPTVQAFFAAVDADDRERLRDIMERALQSRTTESVTCSIVRPNGERRQLRLETAFVESHESPRSHMVGTVTDETEQRRAEELVAEMVTDLSEAERVAGIGSWRWTKSNGHSKWSDGMYRLLDLDPATTPSEELYYSRMHSDDIERARAAAAQASSTGIPNRLEVRMLRSDGVVRDMLLLSRAIFDPAGNLHGFHGVLMDVTERKALESEVRQAQKMEAIGTLAGGVAHDFNNYLLVIGGHAELAAKAIPEHHPAQQSLSAIRFAYERCVHLTEQLLTLSLRRPAQLRRCDLAACIEHLAPMLQSALGATVQLQLQLDHRAPHVLADPPHVEDVVMNLALNAKDAMPEGGTLTLRLSATNVEAQQIAELEPGPYVRLSITDTGCGMDQETLGRIFEPFFTTKPAGKGTGLGLAVAYGTMREAGGGIAAESRIGHGTTFHLYLRPASEAASSPRSKRTRDDLNMRGLRVLVVEDIAQLRDLLSTQLELEGYDVQTAADGLAALSILETTRFDLLISDVVMPNMGGVDLVRAVRKLYPRLPCLLMSGYSASLLSDARLDPPVPLLTKPFTIRELQLALAELVALPAPP